MVLKQRHLLIFSGLGSKSLWRLRLHHTVAVFDGDQMESCSYSHFGKKILDQLFYQLNQTLGQTNTETTKCCINSSMQKRVIIGSKLYQISHADAHLFAASHSSHHGSSWQDGPFCS
jgi:hypothetical protein